VRVLVVNAGSSSLKLRLLGPADELEAEHDLPPADRAALEAALDGLPAPDAVGEQLVQEQLEVELRVVVGGFEPDRRLEVGHRLVDRGRSDRAVARRIGEGECERPGAYSCGYTVRTGKRLAPFALLTGEIFW
jgi:hypothetical protein